MGATGSVAPDGVALLEDSRAKREAQNDWSSVNAPDLLKCPEIYHILQHFCRAPCEVPPLYKYLLLISRLGTPRGLILI